MQLAFGGLGKKAQGKIGRLLTKTLWFMGQNKGFMLSNKDFEFKFDKELGITNTKKKRNQVSN